MAMGNSLHQEDQISEQHIRSNSRAQTTALPNLKASRDE